MPKVSVIIPTYNRGKYIAKAIDSVLAQTLKDHEIIVIDDGSTDNTKDVLTPYLDRITYVHHPNSGISATRNKGIALSLGEYIAFLDSDDYWVADKLAEQVAVLDGEPRVGMVFSRMPIVNEKGQEVGMKPAGPLCRNFQELVANRGDIPTSTTMVRRECFAQVGVFDHELKVGEDTEMWVRIARQYELFEIKDKVLGYYFRHSEQTTSDPVRVYQALIKMDLKFLKDYPELPRGPIIKRIAIDEHNTAREYYNRKNYEESFRHIIKAFRHNLFLGTYYFSPGDGLLGKLWRLTKPYLFLVVVFVKSLAASKGK